PPADGRQPGAARRADGIGTVEGILDAEAMVVATLGRGGCRPGGGRPGGGRPGGGRPGSGRLGMSRCESHVPFVTYLGEIGKLSGQEAMQAALAQDMDSDALPE